MLLRAMMLRRVRQGGLQHSMERLLCELEAIRKVVNIHPKKRGQKKPRTQTVLSKTTDLQQQLSSILALTKEEKGLFRA